MKSSISSYYYFGWMWTGMPKVPKISLHIFVARHPHITQSKVCYFTALRDHQQKTCKFLNRLCLLISNPFPHSSLITGNLHFSWSNVLILYCTYISLTSSYTIHTYVWLFSIYPLLYLFYTQILYFFAVLYFNISLCGIN